MKKKGRPSKEVAQAMQNVNKAIQTEFYKILSFKVVQSSYNTDKLDTTNGNKVR